MELADVRVESETKWVMFPHSMFFLSPEPKLGIANKEEDTQLYLIS